MSFDSEDETPESLAYFKEQASQRAVENWNLLPPLEQQELQQILTELMSEPPRFSRPHVRLTSEPTDGQEGGNGQKQS